MTLGERCDEIVRLIEETLADVGVSTTDPHAGAPVRTSRRSLLADRDRMDPVRSLEKVLTR